MLAAILVICGATVLTSGADKYSSLSGVELVRHKENCIYLQGGVFLGTRPLIRFY